MQRQWHTISWTRRTVRLLYLHDPDYRIAARYSVQPYILSSMPRDLVQLAQHVSNVSLITCMIHTCIVSVTYFYAGSLEHMTWASLLY